MTAQHTPEPWHMNMVSNKTLNVGIYQANGTEVALVKIKSEIEAPRREANARLIAAAPDLLAALQNFVKEFEGCYADGEPAMIAARAAIQKATNKEQA